MKAIVAERGQVTIPKALRDKLGVRQGTTLDFEASNGTLVARKAETDSVSSVFGCLGTQSGDLFDYLESSESIDDFLAGFPTVTRAQVIEFLEQAKSRLVAASPATLSTSALASRTAANADSDSTCSAILVNSSSRVRRSGSANSRNRHESLLLDHGQQPQGRATGSLHAALPV